MVTFGHLDFLVNDALDVVDHSNKVATAHIGRNDEAARHVLAIDGIGSAGRNNVGHHTERHNLAVGVDHEVADLICGIAVRIGHAQGEVERLVAFVHHRYDIACQEYAHHIAKLGHRDAVLGEEFAARDDLQLRPLHLLLHIEVGNAWHLAHCAFDLVA